MEKTKKSSIQYAHPPSVLVKVNVKDLERAINFYKEVFGFEVNWDDADVLGWVELDTYLDGFIIGLNRQFTNISRDEPVFTINVANCEDTKKYLNKKRVQTTEIRDIPNLISMFYLYDSEGNKIAIACPPRF